MQEAVALSLSVYLSMMGPGRPIEMQESIALCAEGAAGPTIDERGGGSVVVVRTVRPRFHAVASAPFAAAFRSVQPYTHLQRISSKDIFLCKIYE